MVAQCIAHMDITVELIVYMLTCFFLIYCSFHAYSRPDVKFNPTVIFWIESGKNNVIKTYFNTGLNSFKVYFILKN